jgi:hypothetical protein
LDVAEHPAGTDRRQLLVVTDEPDTAAPINDISNGGVERERVSAMPASSITTRVDGPMPATQSGTLPCCSEVVSLASVSVWVLI